jgi:hypothetical protein
MVTAIRSIQILIHAPLQKAFDYVSDFTKHGEWSEGKLNIEAVSSESIGIGKEYVSYGEVGKIQKNRSNKLRVSEYEPPHTFGFIANDPDFGDVSHIFTFKEQGDAVLVTRTMTLSLNPIIAFAFNFITYPLIGKPAMQKSFEKLKAKLEQA